jgi:hypothetical protein
MTLPAGPEFSLRRMHDTDRGRVATDPEAETTPLRDR